jgi:hypothetical protein
VSSLGDEAAGPAIKEEKEECEELIMNDTGATPVVSRNPAFKSHGRETGSKESIGMEDAEHPFGNVGGSTGDGTWSAENEKKMANRASRNELPPVSTIPGLGSLSAASQPVSSWMGSASKKWEELQKGPTYVSFHSPLLFG